MERVIFCPDDSLLEKAEKLAKEYALPILIGNNEHIEKLDFDKSKVRPLSIPFDFNLNILKLQVELGLTQCVTFTDEFNIIKNNIKIFNNNEEIPTIWEEKHRVRAVFQPSMLGENEIKVFFNDKMVGNGKYNVYRKNYRSSLCTDL